MEHSQTPTQGTSVNDDKAKNPQAITSSSPQSGSQGLNNQGINSDKPAEVLLMQELLSVLHKVSEQKPESRFTGLMNHGLTLLVVGFVLSAGLGSWLTYVYTRKAQELAAERSLSDELNKLRIQKVGEIWERVDQDRVKIEILVNRISDNNAGDHATQNALLQEIEKLIDTDKETVGQYRFWITQETHDKLNRYLDATIFLVTRQIMEPEADVESLVKEREAARSDVETERAKFVNSQPASRCYLF